MIADPVARPVTTPEELTVNTAVLLLLHTPPDVASLNVTGLVQSTVTPAIADGIGYAVIADVIVQPDVVE
jgi:hypothetical protein